ncbi:unnamed protein product [Coregonus sp. 'balchen']|nr:unnamed protein product [Coregonus sp. 'balchen']
MKTLTCLVFLRFYLSYKWHVKRNCGSSASVRMSVSNEVLLSQPVTIRPRKIKCRKRVTFSGSVTAEKMVVNNVEPVSDHTASEVSERTRDTVDNRETAAPEEVPQVLKRPTHHSPEQAKSFDFADKKEKDTFFQKLRQRYSSMRSIFANVDVGGRSTDTFEDEGDVVW